MIAAAGKGVRLAIYKQRYDYNVKTLHTLNQWVKVQDCPPPPQFIIAVISNGKVLQATILIYWPQPYSSISHYYTELNSYPRNWNSFSIKNKQAKNLFARFKKSPEFQV
jgi:hypothetical protein